MVKRTNGEGDYRVGEKGTADETWLGNTISDQVSGMERDLLRGGKGVVDKKKPTFVDQSRVWHSATKRTARVTSRWERDKNWMSEKRNGVVVQGREKADREGAGIVDQSKVWHTGTADSEVGRCLVWGMRRGDKRAK